MRAGHPAHDHPRLRLHTLTSLQRVSIHTETLLPISLNLDVIGVYLREATGRMGLEVIEVRKEMKMTLTNFNRRKDLMRSHMAGRP